MAPPAPTSPRYLTPSASIASLVLVVDPLKIRSARGTRTQRAYALELGVDQVVVSRWERGESQPGLDSLAKLSREAGQPIEWFLNDREENTE